MKLKHLPFLLALAVSLSAQAFITVQDDAGKMVTLERPAQRVISLAPHATELIFAAGGGDRIVGTVGYSDYPPAALKIPRVGNHQYVDIERIIATKPDLLVVWLHGNSERQLEHVRKLGIPFYFSELKKLDDIPRSVERLGVLMGTGQHAYKVTMQQRARLAALAAQYRERPVVRMFYQVWSKPIYTLNGSNIMSDVIRLCGGENVFASLPVPAPTVSIEAVLLENPEVMMTGDRQADKSSGLEIWRPYKNLLAVRNNNLFSVDADLVNRAGPRLIDGAAMVCEKLEQARSRRTDKR